MTFDEDAAKPQGLLWRVSISPAAQKPKAKQVYKTRIYAGKPLS